MLNSAKKGSVIIMSLLLCIILLTFGIWFIQSAASSARAAQHTYEDKAALQAAYAGASYAIEKYLAWNHGNNTYGYVNLSNGSRFIVTVAYCKNAGPINPPPGSNLPANSLNQGYASIVSIGTYGKATRRIEVTANVGKVPFFKYALFSDDTTTYRGNTYTDSYNSDLGPYVAMLHGAMGNIASNHNIDLENNANIWGSAYTTGTFTQGGGLIHGSILTGVPPSSLPPIVLPTFPQAQVYAVNDLSQLPITKNGSTEARALEPGSYANLDISIHSNNSSLYIKPGDYVFKSFTSTGNGALYIVNAPNQADPRVRIYLSGNNNPAVLKVAGNTKMKDYNNGGQYLNVPKPYQLTWFVYQAPNDNTVKEVQFAGTADIYGAIYAPTASVHYSGDVTLYGAIVSKEFWQDQITGTTETHYDVQLTTKVLSDVLQVTVISWQK